MKPSPQHDDADDQDDMLAAVPNLKQRSHCILVLLCLKRDS